MDNPYASAPPIIRYDSDRLDEARDSAEYRRLEIRSEYILYERLLLGIGVILLMTTPILFIVGFSTYLVDFIRMNSTGGNPNPNMLTAFSYSTLIGCCLNIVCGIAVMWCTSLGRLGVIVTCVFWAIWSYQFAFYFLYPAIILSLLIVGIILMPGSARVCSKEYKSMLLLT